MISTKKLLYRVVEKISAIATAETFEPSITASTGTLVSAEGAVRNGICTLMITVSKASTAPATNVFRGQLADHLPLLNAYGGGYYQGMPFGFNIDSTGLITVRNLSSNTLTEIDLVITVTYIMA